MGHCYFMLDKLNQSIKYHKLALKQAPQDFWFLIDLCKVFIESKYFNKAMTLIDRANDIISTQQLEIEIKFNKQKHENKDEFNEKDIQKYNQEMQAWLLYFCLLVFLLCV